MSAMQDRRKRILNPKTGRMVLDTAANRRRRDAALERETNLPLLVATGLIKVRSTRTIQRYVRGWIGRRMFLRLKLQQVRSEIAKLRTENACLRAECDQLTGRVVRDTDLIQRVAQRMLAN